ncbi:MAG TPA: hypothetical protein VHF69_10090 [Candidatus Synoicihabitans sp.]|nr:hypothetical protein [Candidatus Synoicihabitans sp.]
MADLNPAEEAPLRPSAPRKPYAEIGTDINTGTDAIGGSSEENKPKDDELQDKIDALENELEALKDIIYGPGGPGSGGGLQGLIDALGEGGAMEGAEPTEIEACEDGEAVTITVYAKKAPAA